MPLVDSPTLTPKKLAANRANAQLSRGPITLEGLIRMPKLKREARQVQNSPMNIKNEGTSHDVVDNKGRNFISHDVTDNKAT